MQEIKCPNCGEVFQVDESAYTLPTYRGKIISAEKSPARKFLSLSSFPFSILEPSAV